MTSTIAVKLDKDFHHMHWAGKEYIMSSLEDEYGAKLRSEGPILDSEVLYWIGYIYRYWNLYKKESSKSIYKKAPFKTMKIVYLMYHTMSPELAIERLMESSQK